MSEAQVVDLAVAPIKDISEAGKFLAKDTSDQYCWVTANDITPREPDRGIVLTQLALSLGDQGYSPSYNVAGLDIRKFDQKGHLNWLKRWCKNGFTILQKAAKSGDTIEGALARFDADVLGQNIVPDVVELLLGGNDINAVQNFDEAEAELASMISEFDQILALCRENNISVIVTNMPNNGMWVMNNAQMWLQTHWERHLIRVGRKRDIAAMINLGPLLANPKASWAAEQVVMTRLNNVVTIDWVGHKLESGERVIVYGTIDRTFETLAQPVGTDVTITSANSLTYSNNGPNAMTIGNVIRINVIPEGVSDGTTHFTHYGAAKAAHLAYPIISALFPPRDILSSSENDYFNLVGVGKPLCARRPNIGMMIGTGGSKSGSGGSIIPTGDVADGYEVKVVNGNPATVHCEIVRDSSHAYSQFDWQQIEIQAGDQDCEISFSITQGRPIKWRDNETKIDSDWVRPRTDSPYVYVNVSGQTGTTGTIEPNWPTRIGERIAEGDLLWECRLGLVPGVTTCYAAAAYKIVDMTDRAINAISFGIVDNTTGADSILDFNNNVDTSPPLHYSGEHGHFCTPEAVLGESGSSFDIATKIRVKANGHATVKVNRYTLVSVDSGF